MPVANVTTGTTITEAWGDSVATSVNALEAADTAHAAAANPHPGYATDADLTAHAATPHGGGGGDALPAGAIIAYGAATAPTGYLLCDGSSVLRSTYAALFTAIGTTYGSVDGTHFTLPDLRGRFALGKATAGTGSALGASGGQLAHTHNGAAHVHAGPSHQHSESGHSHTSTGHQHTGASHQHETPFIPGPTTGMRKLPIATFGSGASYTAGQAYTGSSDSTSGNVMLTNTEGNGTGGTTTPGNVGTTTPADSAASGTGSTSSVASGASSAADAPFLAVQYVIKT